MTDPDAWPEKLDATVAAPDSHVVVFENEHVRVLEVIIPAGTREPEHIHARASVMTVTEPARIRSFKGGRLAFESPAEVPTGPRQPSWMEPGGPHSVENIDDHTYRAYRVELKQP